MAMKFSLRLLLFSLLPITAICQQTFVHSDPFQRYLDAKQWFQQENYQLAYPVFKDVEQSMQGSERINGQLKLEELQFYSIACELMQQNESAETHARDFLAGHTSESLKGQLGYYLGMYYFYKQQYPEAIAAFDKANEANLTASQVAGSQFAKGYSYFTQKDFKNAKPLLATAKNDNSSRYYVDANYYHGLIAFSEGKYKDALASFDIAKADPKYAGLVPYYSASIRYSLGKKDEAMTMAEAALKQGNQFYSTQLKKLLGHGYFEKGDYAKSLFYLEQYVAESDKVRKEDLYELGYSYYKQNQLPKAIEQFKPLSGGQDSLSQNAMYLLGDAYLKTNQKANARNAFLFCSTNSSNAAIKEVSAFNFGKLSYELGFDNEALPALKDFITKYPAGKYTPEAKDLLVNVLANTSNYKEALELYSTLSSQSENTKKQYPKILYNRAQQLINDKQNTAAETLLDKALAAPYNESVKPAVLFWKGELAYNKAQFDDAVNYYNQYLQNPVANGDANENNARYNLAYSLLRLEKYGAAQKEFATLNNRRLSSQQQEQDVVVRLADSYYMQKEFDQARSLYTKTIDNRSVAADYAIYQTGMIEGAQNKTQSKLSKLRSLETSYPASILVPAANMEIANTYLADEAFAEALPYLNKIIASKTAESFKPEAYLKAGIAQYNLNKNNEAINSFRTLLKQYPQSPESEDAIDNVRSIFIEEGKPGEYISFLESLGRGVNAGTADSLTYSAAELQLSDGKKEQALASLISYIQKYPEGRYSVVANYNAAELSRDKKDFKNASAYYEFVATKAPNKYAEKAMLAAARIHYFEFKDYTKAATFYQQLKTYASSQENKLEAMRGLVRCQYYSKQYAAAVDNAKDLLNQRDIGADDKIFASLVLGKSAQEAGNCSEAITNYKTVANLSKAEPGAEARYEIANCTYKLNKLEDAEKAAFEVIKKAGSYEVWVTRSYILLGDIYFAQKDYFNAKATYKSVSENSTFPDLKNEAAEKLVKAEAEEQAASKMDKTN
ncbi:MAG: tetratricopeptide repeat protein [Bacteroidota bacterium]